ncbi:Hypothetical_protein [Hexamita inflata]|uniref:Hypothetical_protein n=1 Tax=Hexamita inflata TaxID=28002 RepID=A0AA86Q4I3_9EUKA|nr:Hypothetical protein HINF_LOCUS38036 [Hexamita inflata]
MTEIEQPNNTIETEVTEKNPNVIEIMKKQYKQEEFDRMNKDIQPKAKEGYVYKFGKNGWRQTKIISEEEKQAKGLQLKQTKQLKAQAALQQDQSQNHNEIIQNLQKQMEQLQEQLSKQKQQEEVRHSIKIEEIVKPQKTRVIDTSVSPLLQRLGYTKEQ